MEFQFNLMHVHKFPISETNEMISWELMSYIDQLKEYIKEENNRIKNR